MLIAPQVDTSDGLIEFVRWGPIAGFFAKRVPTVTSVPQRSRYPSSG